MINDYKVVATEKESTTLPNNQLPSSCLDDKPGFNVTIRKLRGIARAFPDCIVDEGPGLETALHMICQTTVSPRLVLCLKEDLLT